MMHGCIGSVNIYFHRVASHLYEIMIASDFGGYLEKETATHSSIHAWKIPWTKEPGGLQSMGSQSRTRLSDFCVCWWLLIGNQHKWAYAKGEFNGRQKWKVVRAVWWRDSDGMTRALLLSISPFLLPSDCLPCMGSSIAAPVSASALQYPLPLFHMILKTF